MLTLGTLPPDLLAPILRYLSGNEVLHLMAIGNTRFTETVCHTDVNIVFALAQFSFFPFSAFKLHKLRSLSVTTTYNDHLIDLNAHSFPKNALELQKELEKLSLKFRSAPTTFNCMVGNEPLLFSNLKELEISGVSNTESFASFVSSFCPKTLTTLKYRLGAPLSMSSTPFSCFSGLPSTLTRLELNIGSIIFDRSPEFEEKEKIFPKSLSILDIGMLTSVEPLNYLPKGLTSLDAVITSANSFTGEKMKISKLPPAITSVYLRTGQNQMIEMDSPLPSSLTHFPGLALRAGIAEEEIPKNLIFSLPISGSNRSLKDQLEEGYPNITDLSIFDDTGDAYYWENLPSKLTSLTSNRVVDAPLPIILFPPTLTTLILEGFPFDMLQLLPKTVTEIHFSPSISQQRFEESLCVLSDNLENVVMFSFDFLEVDRTRFDFSALKNLKTFDASGAIDAIARDARFFETLPISLTHLSLCSNFDEDPLELAVSSLKFRLPKLENFSIAAKNIHLNPSHSDIIPDTKHNFDGKRSIGNWDFLPDSVRFFSISLEYLSVGKNSLKRPYLSGLPTGLYELEFMITTTIYDETKMKANDFENLPYSLAKLSIVSSDYLDEDIIRILPPSIAVLDIQVGRNDPIASKKAKQAYFEREDWKGKKQHSLDLPKGSQNVS